MGKSLYLLLIIAVISVMIFLTGSNNKDKTTEFVKQEQSLEKANTVSSENITKNNAIDSEENIPSYKDIFKEPDKPNTIEEMEIRKSLQDLDEESKVLISQAEKIIKENKLVLAQQEITPEDIKNQEQVQQKINQIKEQLQELDDDK